LKEVLSEMNASETSLPAGPKTKLGTALAAVAKFCNLAVDGKQEDLSCVLDQISFETANHGFPSFQVEQTSTLSCPKCSAPLSAPKIEIQSQLIMVLPKAIAIEPTFGEMYRNVLQMESLPNFATRECAGCHKTIRPNKQLGFRVLGDMLVVKVVRLKEWTEEKSVGESGGKAGGKAGGKVGGKRGEKVGTKVPVPTRVRVPLVWSEGERPLGRGGQEHNYVLVAAACYDGNTRKGHWTAFSKQKSGGWLFCDDEIIKAKRTGKRNVWADDHVRNYGVLFFFKKEEDN